MVYEWLGFLSIGFISLCYIAFYAVIFGIFLVVLWWCRWLVVLLTATFFCFYYGSDRFDRPFFDVPAPFFKQFDEPKSSELPLIKMSHKQQEKPMTDRWVVSDTKPADWTISDSDLDKQFQEMKDKGNQTP